MTDLEYEIRIYRDTGRGIVQDEIKCRDCGGHGFNSWEECQTCDGYGSYIEYVFSDAICNHEVPMCDCKQAWQDGQKGFVVLVDPESVEWMGRAEFESYERGRLHGVRALQRIQVGLMKSLDGRVAA